METEPACLFMIQTLCQIYESILQPCRISCFISYVCFGFLQNGARGSRCNISSGSVNAYTLVDHSRSQSTSTPEPLRTCTRPDNRSSGIIALLCPRMMSFPPSTSSYKRLPLRRGLGGEIRQSVRRCSSEFSSPEGPKRRRSFAQNASVKHRHLF